MNDCRPMVFDWLSVERNDWKLLLFRARRILLTIFCIRALLFVTPVLAEPLIVFDYWWLGDFARSVCKSGSMITTGQEEICWNVEGEISNFEAKLETQISIESKCSDIAFS